MAVHNIKGKEGEKLAVEYLQGLGYHIQCCNWKCSYYEIDIIATKENRLHFIEVKTRHSVQFGNPEEGVTRKKFENMKKATAFFLEFNPYWSNIQFDILSITRLSGCEDEYFLIEDVYI